MKSKITLTFILYTLIGFTACTKKKDDASPNSSSTYLYELNAVINGAPYKGSHCYYLEEYSFLQLYSDSTGTKERPQIAYEVINGFDTGMYDLTAAGANAWIDSGAQQPIHSAYGYLHVAVRTDSVITGTFSFTCTDSTKVTDGHFTAHK